MGYIDASDILGYELKDGTLVCSECFDKRFGGDETKLSDVITEYDKDNYEGAIQCDECFALI